MSTVLVLGASGQIGRFLLPRLRARGDRVIALSRVARVSDEKIEWLVGDLGHDVPPLPPLDTVLSLGPLDAFARRFADGSIDAARVVAIGSMSAVAKQDSPDAAERELAGRLVAAEATIARAAERRGAAWSVLRPTLIYGAGLDRSLTPLARMGHRWRVFPHLPGARGLRQPVHADDLADVALRASERAGASGKVYEVGGGERLAYADMLSRVRRSLPRATLPVPLPLAFARPLARIAARPGFAGALARLGRDLVADNAAAERDLDFAPRRFAPDPACWGLAAPSPTTE